LRAFGLQQYGEFVSTLALITTVIAFSKFPTWQVLLKAPDDQGLDKVFGTALIIEIVLGTIGVIILSVIDNTFNMQLPVYLILIPLFYLRNSTQYALRLKEKYGYYSLIISVGALTRLIGYLILSINSNELKQYILLYTFSVYLEEGLFILASIKQIRPVLRPWNFTFFKQNSNLALTLYLNATIKTFYRGGDLLLVNYLYGPALAGSFKLIKNSGLIFKLIIDPLYQLFFRRDVVNNADDNVRWRIPINTGFILGGYAIINLVGCSILVGVYNQPNNQIICFLFYNVGFFIQFVTLRLQGIMISQGETLFLTKALFLAVAGYLLVILLSPYFSIFFLYLSWPVFYIIWSLIVLAKFKKNIVS